MPSRIDKILWIRRTIEKMEAIATDDKKTWGKLWLKTYCELGGVSRYTGLKECPKCAAYGLWFLGQISGSKRPLQNWSIRQIREELGKNAAYATLAINVLNKNDAISGRALWQEVQSLYQRKLSENPANSDQGAVTLTKLLYTARCIIPSSE